MFSPLALTSTASISVGYHGLLAKLSHNGVLAIIGHGTRLSSLFYTANEAEKNQSPHNSYLTFDFSPLLTFSKALPPLSIHIKRLCKHFILPILIGIGSLLIISTYQDNSSPALAIALLLVTRDIAQFHSFSRDATQHLPLS